MGCLYSCFVKTPNVELSHKFLPGDQKYYESISDEGDFNMNDFSSKNARQIDVIDVEGIPGKRVTVEDFTFLKVKTYIIFKNISGSWKRFIWKGCHG